MPARIAVNGFGTIGKRVARAVKLQDDMQLVGVTKTKPTYEASIAIKEGMPLYTIDDKQLVAFEEQGLKVAGVLSDLLTKVDLVVDCTPNGVGEANKKLYGDENRKSPGSGSMMATILTRGEGKSLLEPGLGE